jgi:hypothetical protein
MVPITKRVKQNLGLLLASVVGMWLINEIYTNPFTNLLLRYDGEIVEGYVVDAYEDYDSNESGDHVIVGCTYIYTFEGNEYRAQSSKSYDLAVTFLNSGDKIPIDVEIWPICPKVSRIHGEGFMLWQEVIFAVIWFGAFAWIFKEFFEGVKGSKNESSI